MTGHFTSDSLRWLCRYRLDQVRADPASERWLLRAVVAELDEVVGHAGFHGPPDDRGMVEVGYSVVEAHRRRGYATAALRALLLRAAVEPEVRVVRASVGPDNVASLATIARFGFVRTGQQWDEVDGVEIVHEVSVRA